MKISLPMPGRWLAPPRCVFCGAGQPCGRLCAACCDDLPWIASACPQCAEPLYESQNASVSCAACQRSPPPWSACIAPLHYEFPVDSALKALKFRHGLYYAPAFASLLLPWVRERLGDVDALAPVPLSRWRQARRGFNQAAELCRPIARARGLPILTGLRRVRATASQSGLDRAARRRNLRGAFGLAAPLVCRYPLIVDDVMTTGETCRQLAKLLLGAGATRVAVLVVARAASRNYEAGTENV